MTPDPAQFSPFICVFNKHAMFTSPRHLLEPRACCRAWSLQSCLTLCDPLDCSPPGPLSMGFSRQEYWSGLPCPPPGIFSTQGSNSVFYVSSLSCLAGRFFTTEPQGKPKEPGDVMLHKPNMITLKPVAWTLRS